MQLCQVRTHTGRAVSAMHQCGSHLHHVIAIFVFMRYSIDASPVSTVQLPGIEGLVPCERLCPGFNFSIGHHKCKHLMWPEAFFTSTLH